MTEEEFYNQICLNGSVHPIEGTSEIYDHNIISVRTQALIDIFPSVTACLSEDYISYIAPDFCRKYDAPSGNLNFYGREFGTYLSHLPACAPYEFIKDLADLIMKFKNYYIFKMKIIFMRRILLKK